MYKIVIADSSATFSNELASCLPNTVSAKICGSFDAALEMLNSSRYDLIVLDLSLPGCDSIQMLYELAEVPNPPAVLATVPYISDYVRSTLAGMGIGYLFTKPCQIGFVVKRIQEMLSYYSENSAVEDPLRKLSIPQKLSGSSYIRSALSMLMANPNIQLTKELYPRIGAANNKSAASIERSIRNVIHTTWKRHDGYIWQAYLPTDETGRTHRPSNGEFFDMLTQVVNKTG